MTQQNNKPAFKIRRGLVQATIWENKTDKGFTRHNVSFTRSYRVEDEWRETQSFGRDDLPKLIKCADAAYDWIFTQNGDADDNVEGQPDGQDQDN